MVNGLLIFSTSLNQSRNDFLLASPLELVDVGIVGMNQILRDRLARLEQRCRSAGLIWIAEILVDLLQAHDYYQQQ